jgi:hypothetical protein
MCKSRDFVCRRWKGCRRRRKKNGCWSGCSGTKYHVFDDGINASNVAAAELTFGSCVVVTLAVFHRGGGFFFFFFLFKQFPAAATVWM